MVSSDAAILGAIPRIHGAFTAICGAMVACTVAWAGWFPMEVVVRAPGVLRPVANVSSVKNPLAGELWTKDYRTGAWVEAGQVLWRIDTKATELDRGNTLRHLQRLRREWEALVAFSSALETGNRETGTSVVPDLSEAVSRTEAYFAHLGRLELLAAAKKDRWARESALPPGLTLNQTLADLADEWRLADLDVVRFRAQERDALYAEQRRVLTSIEELESRLAEVERRLGEAEVRAPISGVVEDARKFNPGDFLVAGEEIVRIVPVPQEGLRLELRVDPRDVAELRVGQLVRCLFPGLPPSRFGSTSSTVVAISPDATLVGGQAYFLVEAPLGQGWLQERSGRRVTLKPGMLVDTRIIVGRKTVLASFLEKLEFIP